MEHHDTEFTNRLWPIRRPIVSCWRRFVNSATMKWNTTTRPSPTRPRKRPCTKPSVKSSKSDVKAPSGSRNACETLPIDSLLSLLESGHRLINSLTSDDCHWFNCDLKQP